MSFEPVRVLRWHQDKPRSWIHTNWIWQSPFLEQCGVRLVDRHPDVIVTATEMPDESFDPVPVIFERTVDQTKFNLQHERLLAFPQLKSVFVNHVFRDFAYYDRPQVSGSYYGHVWEATQCDGRFLPKLTPPQPTKWSKLKLVLPLTEPPSATDFDQTKGAPKLEDRPINFSFSGRIDYQSPPPFPQRQRQRMGMMWDSLPGAKCWFDSDTWQLGLERADYLHMLCHTKIVISPWGFGAWNIRDYEALLCGAILVKPECSGLRVLPDIYEPSNLLCHMCDVDLDNLVDLCQFMLRNLAEFQPLVNAGRRLMEETFYDTRPLIENWSATVREVAEAGL